MITNKQAAITIIRKLRSSGFEALLAGGCVRDMLLGKKAKDFDVATNAQPQDIINLFKRTLKLGAKFGVIVVMLHGRQVEVATFRQDSDYLDGRHPSAVKFTTAAADASRRDFTINGMFYDPVEEKIIDYVNGRADLKKRLIRTIGSANRRFGEDYLRMLRAVRFSARLDFSIETETYRAICKNAGHIGQISSERIAVELEGILTCPNRDKGAAMLIETGLADHIFPGFNKTHKSALNVIEQLGPKIDFALSLAAFFVDLPTGRAMEQLKGLKLSRNHIKGVKFLLANRAKLLDENITLAQLKMLVAEPYFDDLYQLQQAIEKAEPADSNGLNMLRKLKKRINALDGVDLKPKPLLNGHDLIRLGAAAGPDLGQLAREMYIAQLEGTVKNKADAEKWGLQWLKSHKQVAK